MLRITENKLRNTIRKEYIKVLYESGAITRKQLHELDLKGKKSVEDELGGAEWYNPKTGQFEKKKQEKSQDRFAGLGSEMDRISGRMGESDAVRTTRTAYIPKPGEKWDAPRGTSGHRRPMKAQGETPRSDEPGARAGRKLSESDYDDYISHLFPKKLSDIQGSQESRGGDDFGPLADYEQYKVIGHIQRLAKEKGMAPEKYLQSLGFDKRHPIFRMIDSDSDSYPLALFSNSNPNFDHRMIRSDDEPGARAGRSRDRNYS